MSRRQVFAVMYRIHRLRNGRMASAWIAAKDAFRLLSF